MEQGTNPIRREGADSPQGLSGLVFRTFDAAQCHTALQERGFAVELPLAFSRPVEIDGKEELAAFRTVRLKPAPRRAGGSIFANT